ncbi:YgcG family protein [Pelistega suis]|uniref:YgcG family protein n=2 Tax=Pelistega suis TaxID=1631957 RepID=A0A849P3X3_9BURK|nr:YgcG family protein [Pelistega suis]
MSALLIFIGSAFAQEVEIPASTNYVVDTTATLSASELDRLNAQLKAFDEETGSQIFVLMVPTVQPETIETYAVRVFEAWKVGRKGIDDGVLLVIAKNDRRHRLEVGYGLEGAIPDVLASRILNENVNPYFRQGDFAGGIASAVTRMMGLIKNEGLPSKGSSADIEQEDWMAIVIPIAVVFIFAILGHPAIGAMVAGSVTFGIMGSPLFAVVAAVAVFIIASIIRFIFREPISAIQRQNASRINSRRRGGWGPGGFGGGFGGGGFGGGFGGGGGGSSGGGGASGGW